MNKKFIDFFIKSYCFLSKSKFKLYDNSPRPILLYWKGTLPINKEYVYTLIIIKFTGWVSANIDPKILHTIKKNKPGITHEISCVYYKNAKELKSSEILFSFQMESNDTIVKQITEYLATVMLNCQPESAKFLLDKYQKDFWINLSLIKLSEIVSTKKSIMTEQNSKLVLSILTNEQT